MSNGPSSAPAILGMGHCWPQAQRTSADIETEHSLPSGWIAKHTGIVSRHVCGSGESTLTLSVSSIHTACQRAGVTPDQLDAIIFAGISRQQLIPCTASLIAGALAVEGLACFDVDATCLSFLVGLDQAAMQIASGRHRLVAVVSCEIASRCLDWNQPASAVLMGDGAAAAIIGPSQGPGRLHPLLMRTYPAGAHLAELTGFGTRQILETPDQEPCRNLFHMQGPQLFRFASGPMQKVVAESLAQVDWEVRQVDALVPHQASAHALRSIAKQCKFTTQQVLENIGHAGNCLSASIPLLLSEASGDGRIKPGDRVLLAGTAAGVAVAALPLIW